MIVPRRKAKDIVRLRRIVWALIERDYSVPEIAQELNVSKGYAYDLRAQCVAGCAERERPHMRRFIALRMRASGNRRCWGNVP